MASTRPAGAQRAPGKAYRVQWIGEPVAAFDQLQTAIQYLSELHRDKQHIVIYRGGVIWPDNVRRRCRAR
jgi:hypothetical protein